MRGRWLTTGRTVYALEHAGWRKGVEEFRNWFSFHVQGGPDTPDAEVAAVVALAAAAPALFEAAQETMRAVEAEYPEAPEQDDEWLYDVLGSGMSAAYITARAAIAAALPAQPSNTTTPETEA